MRYWGWGIWYLFWMTVVALMGIIVITIVSAFAHMPDRPDLDQWFMGLRSPGGGLCCSLTEGKTLTDVEVDTQNGHYRVFIDGHWLVVNDNAVVQGPNRYGSPIVWPLEYTDSTGKRMTYGVRCFMPGAGG